MWRSSAVACVALLGASSVSAPNDKRILGKDDIQFAEALRNAGYRDLQEVVLGAIERTGGGATSDDGLKVAWSRLASQKDDADREPDPRKRVDMMAKLVEQTEAFIDAHKGTPAAIDAMDRLPDLYRSVGETTAAALSEVAQPADAADLRTKGVKMFERALDVIKLRKQEALDKIKELSDALVPDEDALAAANNQLEAAMYGLARTYYFQSLLQEAGSFPKTYALNTAIKELQDFEIDFSDRISNYEGYIYKGLCYKELGEADKAIEAFDDAISVRDLPDFEPTPQSKGKYVVEGDVADLISAAVLQKALFLGSKGEDAKALAAIDDFLTTTPEAEQTLKGLALLVLKAETHGKLGDQQALETVAKRLIEIDPRGSVGARGRQLLGEGGGGALGVVDTIRLAASAANEKDFPRAIGLYQQALILARGSPEQANYSTEAGVSLGAMLSTTDILAAIAVWDTLADRFPQGKDASECLWRTVNGYSELQKQERRPFYKTRARERMNVLVSRYPTSPYASKAAIMEGQFLEADQDYAGAAAIYEGVAPGSTNYEEALYRAANAWSRRASKLFQEKKSADGKQIASKAEAAFQKVKTVLDAAATNTLDLKKQAFLRGLAFNARMGIANIYLMKEVNRSGEVAALADEMERTFSDDAEKVATARNLRMRASIAAGKVDEAMALLDAQIRANPNSAAAGSSAAQLAQVLDARGAELRKKDPASAEAEALWHKAANYYLLGIRGQMDGLEAMNVDSFIAIANRLYALALHFDRVPDNVDTFIDWTGKPTSDDLFQNVAQAFEAVVSNTPDYRPRLSLARSLGFLKKWERAATRYAEIFEQEKIVNSVTQTLDATALRDKPELLFAYLEWGFCEREVGVATNDPTRIGRASKIFETLLDTAQYSQVWWQAKYYQLQAMVDRGEYTPAHMAITNLSHTTEDFDGGKYGLRDRFHRMQDDLARKVDPTKVVDPPKK